MSKNKIVRLRNFFGFISYFGLFAPISILLVLNFDIYFKENKAGLSVATGGILLFLMVVLLMKFGFKKFNKLFWMTFLLIIVMCLETILQDSTIIVFCAWIGCVWFTIFEMPLKYYQKHLDSWNDESTRENARVTSRNNNQTRNGRC